MTLNGQHGFTRLTVEVGDSHLRLLIKLHGCTMPITRISFFLRRQALQLHVKTTLKWAYRCAMLMVFCSRNVAFHHMSDDPQPDKMAIAFAIDLGHQTPIPSCMLRAHSEGF